MPLASCLIYAWPLPAVKWAVTNQLSGRHVSAFFTESDNNMPYPSNLSDQSAMKIRVMISDRLKFALFSYFFAENNENERVTFREFYLR